MARIAGIENGYLESPVPSWAVIETELTKGLFEVPTYLCSRYTVRFNQSHRTLTVQPSRGSVKACRRIWRPRANLRPVQTRKLIRGAFALTLLATACSKGEDPAKKVVASPSPSPKPVYCPLTGTETSRDFDTQLPALAVKIENSVASRPQAGLSSADIVYEELAEGGITRFLAIFQCATNSNLGPVRSARSVDPDILLEYAPVLFAHSGANPVVLNKVQTTKGVIDLRHGANGEAYHREKGRAAPHNLFTSIAKIRALKAASEARGVPTSSFVFAPTLTATAPPTPPPASSKSPAAKNSTPPSPSPSVVPPGTSVTFSYSSAINSLKYVYDSAGGGYLRFHGEMPHKSVSGEQIRAVNVIVLKVRVTQGKIKDAAGNSSPEISVTGTGEAVVLRGGVSVIGSWRRTELKNRTTILDAAGKPIPLLPGNIWIHLVPAEQQVSVQ